MLLFFEKIICGPISHAIPFNEKDLLKPPSILFFSIKLTLFVPINADNDKEAMPPPNIRISMVSNLFI